MTMKDFFKKLTNLINGKKKFDTVDESSKESFPASDSPAWSTGDVNDIERPEDDPNNPAGILIREHKIIMKAIYAMLNLAEDLQNNKQINKELLLNVAEFFHHFVALCHHKKEDSILFPALEKSGLNLANTPFLAIKEDHAAMNELVEEFEKYSDMYAANDASAKARLIDIAGQVESLYPTVMLKEENFIFPLIKKLNSSEQQALLEHFTNVNQALGTKLYNQFMNFSE